jgi:hypothetical protein
MQLQTVFRRLTRGWASGPTSRYGPDMGIARSSRHIDPVRRLAVLDEYAGEWVAIKDDNVIAHSSDPREVVRQMRRLGAAAQGAVLQRASVATEALAVGMG